MPYNSGKNAESKDNTLRPPKSKRSETQAKYQLGSLGTEGRLRFRPEARQRAGAGGGHPRLGATSDGGVTGRRTPHHPRGPVTAASLLPHVSGDFLGRRPGPRSQAERRQPAYPCGDSEGGNGPPFAPPGAILKNSTATFARVWAETALQANCGPQGTGRRRWCVPKSMLTTLTRARAPTGRRAAQEPQPRRAPPPPRAPSPPRQRPEAGHGPRRAQARGRAPPDGRPPPGSRPPVVSVASAVGELFRRPLAGLSARLPAAPSPPNVPAWHAGRSLMRFRETR